MPNELAEFCDDDLLAQAFFKASQSRKNTLRRTSVAAMQRTLMNHDVIVDRASVLALMAHLEVLGAGKLETGNPEIADGFEWEPDLLSVAARAGFINQWTEGQPAVSSGETGPSRQEASSEYLYRLSDEQLEYQTLDRLSFQRFAGIHRVRDVPDCTTVWRFRERLTAGRGRRAPGVRQAGELRRDGGLQSGRRTDRGCDHRADRQGAARSAGVDGADSAGGGAPG